MLEGQSPNKEGPNNEELKVEPHSEIGDIN